MANRVCPQCGSSYVDWVTVCSDCRLALVDPDQIEDPRQLADEYQLVYELGGWTLDQQTSVAAAMAESGIPHAWDGADLVVHVDYESTVDALLEPIEAAGGGGGGAPAVGADGEPEEETEYDLTEWPPAERLAIVERLVEAGVPHRWEEALLLVPISEEDVVDEVLDDIELGGDDAAIVDDGMETPFTVLEGFFLAAERLRNDPMDAAGLGHLVEATAGADPLRPPYGVDLAVWTRALGLADALSEAIASPGGADVPAATDAANDLHDLLRDLV